MDNNFYIRYHNQHKGKFGFECEEIEINNKDIYYTNFSSYHGNLSPVIKHYKIGTILKCFFIKLLLDHEIIEENVSISEKQTCLEYRELEIFFNQIHISFRIQRVLPFYKILVSRDPIRIKKLLQFLTVNFILKLDTKKYCAFFNTYKLHEYPN